MDSQYVVRQTFSKRKMVQARQIVGGKTLSLWKMVHVNHSSRTYVWIRRIVLVSHGVASNICWKSYSSRTYVRIRRMVLVSLRGVSDLFNIMPVYSDGVWI
jgi:hypothetical protein